VNPKTGIIFASGGSNNNIYTLSRTGTQTLVGSTVVGGPEPQGRRELGLLGRIHARGAEPGGERRLLAVVEEHTVDTAEEGREQVPAGRAGPGREQVVDQDDAARPSVDSAGRCSVDPGALQQGQVQRNHGGAVSIDFRTHSRCTHSAHRLPDLPAWPCGPVGFFFYGLDRPRVRRSMRGRA